MKEEDEQREGRAMGDSGNQQLEKEKEDEETEPVNVLVYFSFLLGGLSYFTPVYSITAAVDYYVLRFPNTPILIQMSIIRHVCSIAGIISNNVTIEAIPLTGRILFAYVALTSLMLFITLTDVLFSLFPTDIAHILTLLVVALVSAAQAVQQSSFYGYANMMPKRYTEAVLVGESSCGLITSLLRIATKLAVKDERLGTLIFFFTSIGLLAVCCAGFLAGRLSEFVKRNIRRCSEAQRTFEETGKFSNIQNKPSNRAEGERDVDEHSGLVNNRFHGDNSAGGVRGRGHGSEAGTMGDLLSDGAHGSTQALVTPKRSVWRERLRARWEVTKVIYPFMVAYTLNFGLTMTLFPGIVSEIINCPLGTWLPVILMTLFNFCDLTGMLCSSSFARAAAVRCYLIGPTLRLAFIPLVILCILPHGHPVLGHVTWSIVLTGLMGVTHGMLGVVPISEPPKYVEDHHRELCGNMMLLSSIVPLVIGSILSYLLEAIFSLHSRMDQACNNTIAIYNVTNGTGVTSVWHV
ncbi:equilibrative nucleoside transporter 4 [Aplysia californica]|uniref:Equilibrative nucleoside transporter 4 n=1 Tax=Aplysia californica TaxID=6500 RepID=A0ABM1AG15_APLCA|nr:equilibrative nucleoside transporter 4 [Aplysia californica]